MIWLGWERGDTWSAPPPPFGVLPRPKGTEGESSTNFSLGVFAGEYPVGGEGVMGLASAPGRTKSLVDLPLQPIAHITVGVQNLVAAALGD